MPVIKFQRYFFDLRWSDHEDDDANGTLLADDAAALNYADPFDNSKTRATTAIQT
jgi:hypothetical protein